jgi:hypothetical protein
MAGLTQWVVWSLLVSLVTCETSQQWRARIEANIDRVRKADAEIRELSHRVHRIFKGGIHHFSAESRLYRLFKITTRVAFSGSCNSPIQGEKRDLSRVFRPESWFSIILTRVKILVVFLPSNLFICCVLMYSYFLLCVVATNSELMLSILCSCKDIKEKLKY